MHELVVDRSDSLLGEDSSAVFSGCRTYRYALVRTWDPRRPRAVFIMCNPSTADAHQSDPTVTRCLRFARRWVAGGLLVLNLFALRATDPRELYSHADPVGPLNDHVIDARLSDEREPWPVVCAWGVHGLHRSRGAVVAQRLRGLGLDLMCLDRTRDGHPRHPLYVRGDALPRRYDAGGCEVAGG